MTTAKNKVLNWLLLNNCYLAGAMNCWWWCMFWGWSSGMNFDQ